MALLAGRCQRSVILILSFVACRQDFKFFSEMDGIFRKQLKVDDSDSDLLAPEEPEEYAAEPELGRGEILNLNKGDF